MFEITTDVAYSSETGHIPLKKKITKFREKWGTALKNFTSSILGKKSWDPIKMVAVLHVKNKNVAGHGDLCL